MCLRSKEAGFGFARVLKVISSLCTRGVQKGVGRPEARAVGGPAALQGRLVQQWVSADLWPHPSAQTQVL